ncbi:MAG TPA: hypothetical protein VMF53_00015 [Alphaproteobacteria bacterium]|nr:hypothetical protein [Alphaproteobacteria bacterium]
MTTLQTLLSSRAIDAVVFTALVVFTVTSLTALESRRERSTDFAQIRRVALVLAALFWLMMIGGIADFAIAGALNFLNLAFFLTGAAGLGILTGLMFQRDADKELRRIAASDL